MLLYEACDLWEYQIISEQTELKDTQVQGKIMEALSFPGFLGKTKANATGFMMTMF